MSITISDAADSPFSRNNLKDLAENLKFLYIDYFLSVDNPSYKTFKEHHLDITEIFLDRIDDKYCEWIEGRKRDIIDSKGETT